MMRKPGGPRALNCPSCGAPIIVRAAGASLSVICENCGSTLDAADPDLKILHQSHAALSRPHIALGSRGVLAGTEWEVVGYLERSGDGGDWREYLLFNPWHGYRFLIDADGWRLGTPLDRQPTEIGDRAALDGRSFEFQARYAARVDFVVGEFYWRVQVGETVEASDFGEPWQGTTLSREVNASEVSWTRLESIPGATVAAAFGLQHAASNAPDDSRSPYGRPLLVSFIIAGLSFVALLVVNAMTPAERRVASETLVPELDGTVVTRLIGPIAITRAASAIAVRAATNIDNAWVELDYALVERASQRRFEAGATAEYYTGRDSDGSWSEGEPRPEVKFASIPRGTYDLVVEAKAQKWQGGSRNSGGYDIFGDVVAPDVANGPPVVVTVTVHRDTDFRINFVLALLAISLWPATLFMWHQESRGRRARENDW